MFFTQDDYRKIEEWLRTRTVKDSEFPHADPLRGNEDVPIIQDGKNKTLTIDELVKQVAMMELPDFFNVTTFAKKGNLFLEEAINCIPVEQRKLGLTITFHSAKGHWLIYQFKGTSLNQWSSLNYWRSPIEEALEELVLYPDEEDITGVRDGNRTFLKFKDKDYDPVDFSGMGRIMLRKNLVGTEACSLDDEDHLLNVLTQDMIREENTVYIVQYDFDLDGKVISIPKGCTLWFQGGSINNGTIYLQETAILGAFEFADMGDAKLFGKFNTGQVMTFSNDSYKAKEGGYFVATTKPSSASISEDAKNEREMFYCANSEAYVTKTRQELRWWNGEEWIRVLDITDYNEFQSIILDLIDKHNTEMSACYRYFKTRCYALELRMDDAESRLDSAEGRLDTAETRLDNHDSELANHENRIAESEKDIVNINEGIDAINSELDNVSSELGGLHDDINNVNSRVDNIDDSINGNSESIEEIKSSINSLESTISNLDTIIINHIQNYIKDLPSGGGTSSVTVNGTKYEADAQGNITLPNYPSPDEGIDVGGLSVKDTYNADGTINISLVDTYNDNQIIGNEITLPFADKQGVSGLMQSDDKKKLDALDGLTATVFTQNNSIAISLQSTSQEEIGSTYVLPDATQSRSGLMSKEDKIKLDSLSTNTPDVPVTPIVTPKEPLTFTGAVEAVYDGTEAVTINIPTPNPVEVPTQPDVTLESLNPKSLIIQDVTGSERAKYTPTQEELIKLGAILFKTSEADTWYNPLDSTQTIIDLRPLENQKPGQELVVLYSGEIARDIISSSSWYESIGRRHESIGAVSVRLNQSCVEVTLSPKAGYDIRVGAASSNCKSTNAQAYNSPTSGGFRSTGCWMQCATGGSNTVYLHAWATANANNDSVHSGHLNTKGTCLSFSLIVTGFVTKN